MPWDDSKSLPSQPICGPPTRVMAGLLDRIAEHGPQIPTEAEWVEINLATQRRMEWEIFLQTIKNT